MKLTINKDECTACELCVDTCPELFEMGEDTAIVKVEKVPANQEDCAREAVESCPVEAIKLIEE